VPLTPKNPERVEVSERVEDWERVEVSEELLEKPP
jgi:hypothetical protein